VTVRETRPTWAQRWSEWIGFHTAARLVLVATAMLARPDRRGDRFAPGASVRDPHETTHQGPAGVDLMLVSKPHDDTSEPASTDVPAPPSVVDITGDHLDLVERRVAELVGRAGVASDHVAATLTGHVEEALAHTKSEMVEEFAVDVGGLLGEARNTLAALVSDFESALDLHREALRGAADRLLTAQQTLAGQIAEMDQRVAGVLDAALEGWEGADGVELSSKGVIKLNSDGDGS
jgi:hypothetical protein